MPGRTNHLAVRPVTALSLNAAGPGGIILTDGD